jgi:hypothetical protein
MGSSDVSRAFWSAAACRRFLGRSAALQAAHVLLFDQHVATHAKEAAMMMCTGPIVGGLFAWIASKLVTKNAVQKPGTA